MLYTIVAASLVEKNLHRPLPVLFNDKVNYDFVGDFKSMVNDVKVEVQVKFPNMKMKNVNLDSASWIMDATCTSTTVNLELDTDAPYHWPEKAFVFIGQRWCVDLQDGPWYVASNIVTTAMTVSMDIERALPEDHADYFEVTAKLVKKQPLRKRALSKDFSFVQLPYCFDPVTHGTCQKDMPLFKDDTNEVICTDCWAYMNFGFLYKATGRIRKFYKGIDSTINMAAKGEMSFDFKVINTQTKDERWEKTFNATKLISKIIPIIDIPDVLQLHPEASLWAGARLSMTRQSTMTFGVEGDMSMEIGQGKPQFHMNIVPHPTTIATTKNKGLVGITLTADVSLVFSLLNGLLEDRAGTYFDNTAAVEMDALSEQCPNKISYQLLKGYEMGLHLHGNKKPLLGAPLSPMTCKECSGCLSL